MLTINNTLDGYLKDVEILGNTIQNEEDLADIRSVGDKVEGQELYEIPVLSVGKNLLPPFESWTLDGNVKLSGKNEVTQIQTTVYQDKIISPYINIDSSKSYVLSKLPASLDTYVYQLQLYEFDKNLQQIGSIRYIATPSFTVLDGRTKYIRLIFNTGESISGTYVFKDIQLEEGTQPTPYEPYQEDKLTILSPTPLEKVGDVADRIIEKDGVWGVEKNTIRKSLTASSVAHNGTVNGLTEYIIDTLENSDTTITSNVICNKLVNKFSTTEEGCFVTKNQFRVRVLTNTYPNTESIKNEVINNKWYIIYKSAQPQFIPLPHDQQIKLRTFANKTNISFLTETEGTIKAQVPKSLGATVNTHTEQINNLNNELNRVKKLEESTVSTVTTESDFTTVEATSNGYFEDVKLEGKTLVNLCAESGAKSNYYITSFKLNNIDASKEYTLRYTLSDVVKGNYTGVFSIEITDTANNGFKHASFENGTFTYKIKPREGKNEYRVFFWTHSSNDGQSYTVKDVILLEGDHTQNPPSGYIEGLKSVGDTTDEIVVSSVNENLVPSDWDYKFQCFGDIKVNQFNTRNFEIVNTNTVDGIAISKNFINKFCPNNKVVFDFYSNQRGVFYVLDYGVSGEGYKPVQGAMVVEAGRNVFVVDVSNVSGRLAFRFNNNTKNSTMIISDFAIKTSKNSNNVNHQADKKRLLYYNNETQTWEKPILRQWDSIEKHADGKYYYHQRSAEIVLNGSEDWKLYSDPNSIECIPFEYVVNDKYNNPNTKALNLVNDKFSVKDADTVYAQDVEGIVDRLNLIRIKIQRSKLSTQDVAGFKQWLQANNVTVVYQLAKEKVYECTNIDLITYANETNYLVESGVLSPKTTLKVHNNISNVVSLLQKKVSLLESNMTKYMITQNRLQLSSTHSADSVTFKVDYTVCSENMSQENYDTDLYNLILNNILVGKDNYDYDHMFNIIMDYASWSQISWDQFDILVGLMDIQHNPPIEEMPTDDEIVEETPNEIM